MMCPCEDGPSGPLPATDLTIGVTGLNATDNPGPGVSVIRSLRHEVGFTGRVVGLAYDSLEPGVYARDLVDASYLMPYPSEGGEALFERLCEIQRRAGIDVLLPTLDAEIPAFISLAERLKGLGIRTFLPTREQFDLRSKVNLERLARRADVSVPRTVVVSDPETLHRLDRDLCYPMVVKGPVHDAAVAHDYGDLRAAFEQARLRWGLPVIVQEFVQGEEYDVAVLGDGAGTLLGAVPMKKMFLTDKGKGWVGVAIQEPRLAEMTRRLIETLGWRGPCEVEVIREQGTGAYRLLEINPRFPAWVYLSAGAGMNLPYACALLAGGRSVPPFRSFRVGTLFVRISVEQIAHISDLERITSAGELLHRAAGGEGVGQDAGGAAPYLGGNGKRSILTPGRGE